jgi:hypothetical protein
MPALWPRKPLKDNAIEEARRKFAACAIIVRNRSQVVDSKDGEMSEWLKEHAWKLLSRSAMACYRF